ncbi:MAG: preprotein translocase subunit YajC [Planctomycetota bacterium]
MRQDAQPSIPGVPNAAGAAPAGGGEAGQSLQPGAAQGLPPGAQPAGGGLGSMLPFIAIIGVFVLMIFLSGRSQRKEQKRKQELLSSLRKHDRVQTIGGIIGSISEVRDDEVVLIIDEQTKSRLRVAKSAVQQVLREAAGGETADDDSAPDPAATPELARNAG